MEKEMDSLYDKETEHGTNTKKQKEWDEKISRLKHS